MFENIGSKIKVLAIVETIIGILASILFGFVLFSTNLVLGVLIMVFGALSSWAGSFCLYGFGELIENTAELIAINKERERRESTLSTRVHGYQKRNGNEKTKNDIVKDSTTVADAEKDIVEKSPVPMKVYKNADGKITCPVCKFEQNEDRQVCWKCGQPFINGQQDIPYWCANCGQSGPYDDACPNCKSTLKRHNY